MNKDINKIAAFLSENTQLDLLMICEEQESKDYNGHNFRLGNHNIKYRQAKITPKKVGQFVSLWKRNSEKKTEAFHEADPFDFYIILTQDNDKLGFFLFPKSALVAHSILSNSLQEGKRGFRVYPTWTTTENLQAQKTQKWQSLFFIDCKNDPADISERIKSILRS